MANETFASREGTADFGKDYEYLMAAYYGLTFSLNEEIHDFKISSNNNDMGDFDDVVLEVKLATGEEHVFAIQLKHKFRTIAQIQLTKGKSDYGLLKYCEEFKKIKANYKKKPGLYNAPFSNFHFVLISITSLENCDEFDETWKTLEPVVDGIKQEANYCAQRCQQSLASRLLSVPQTKDACLFKFKAKKEDPVEAEFLQQFTLYTKQKNAKQMESLIADQILQTFQNYNSNAVLNYLNYFSYWCRRDYGTIKLTKRDVTFKLAELVLTPYIAEPEMKVLNVSQNNLILLSIFIAFDIVLVKQYNDALIDKIWNILLSHFPQEVYKYWNTPVSNFYMNEINSRISVPLSALSENFNEMTIKKIYILTWHLQYYPLFIKIEKSSSNDILRAIHLAQDNGIVPKFILIDNGNFFQNDPKRTVLTNLSDISEHCNNHYNVVLDLTLISIQGRASLPLRHFIDFDKKFLEIVTTNEIISMFANENVVGEDSKKHCVDFYIHRFVPKVLIAREAVDNVEDFFVIESEDDLSKVFTQNAVKIDAYLLLGHYSHVKDFSVRQLRLDLQSLMVTENNQITSKGFAILVKGACPKGQFEEICDMNPEKTCHHLRYLNSETLEWIESRGNINKIEAYRVDTQRPEHLIEDNQVLSYFSNKIHVICAESGMGKSRLMEYLIWKCPVEFWTIKIDLGEHAMYFKQTRNADEIALYFLNKSTESTFVKNVVDIYLSKQQILFVWDGFDELPEECESSVTDTIKSLEKNGFLQWITTRQNSKQYLEQTFATLTLTLTDFSSQDQYEYAYHYLKQQISEECKIEETINKINKNVSTNLNSGHLAYTGIPLQIHMVVDIYLRSDNVSNLEFVTLADIYQHFIKNKFEDLFQRANADLDNYSMQQICEEYVNSQLILYEAAAVQATFDAGALEGIAIDCQELFDDLKESDDSLGLIVRLNDEGKAVFAHKTYKEFLVASWLAKHCHQYPHLLKKLFEDKHISIRFFCDLLLARDSPVHLAVLYRNLDSLKEHSKDIEKGLDRGGRTALQLACSWGSQYPVVDVMKEDEIATVESKSDAERVDFVTALLNAVRQMSPECSSLLDTLPAQKMTEAADRWHSETYNRVDSSVPSKFAILINAHKLKPLHGEDKVYLEIIEYLIEQKSDLFSTDSLLNWNAFQYADASLCLAAINALLGYKAINANILTNYNHVPTLMHYFVNYSFNNLKDVVSETPYIEYKYQMGRTSLLQMACDLNNLIAIKTLLQYEQYKEVINNQSTFLGNVLTTTVMRGDVEMLDVLLENGAKVNGHTSSPLAFATFSCKFECCRKLVEAGADVDGPASDGNTPLIFSLWLKHVEIMKFLLEQGADANIVCRDLTALDYAVHNQDVESISLLLKYGANINRQCADLGYAALHRACEYDNLDVVRCLLKNGADTTLKSNKLLTPLLVSLLNKNEELALELIAVDPSVINEYSCHIEGNKTSAIVLAAMRDYPDVIEALVQHGADVEASGSDTSPLHFACYQHHNASAIVLLKAGAAINKIDTEGRTPLYHCVKYLDTTQLLLDNGANVNAADLNGNTILHSAVFNSGVVEVIEELMTKGAIVNAKNAGNQTPLYFSILATKPEVTKLLLDKGAVVENEGELLCLAARLNAPDCIDLLISKGADVNSKDKFGISPLFHAVQNDTSCVKILLENGADPVSGFSDLTPLLWSIAGNKHTAMRELINGGADVNGGIITPLNYAAGLGNMLSMILLMENGAKVNATDSSGLGALHYACGNYYTLPVVPENDTYLTFSKEDCVKELVARGANMNHQNDEGVTALHLACAGRKLNIMKILVENGAEVNAPTKTGKTALHLCCDVGEMEAGDFLLKHGADVNIMDNDGRTPGFDVIKRVFFQSDEIPNSHSLEILDRLSGNILLNNDTNNSGTFSSRQTALIQYLVFNGLSVNYKSEDDSTPLYRTCFGGNYEGSLFLIERGADFNLVTKQHQYTPLHAAAIKGHPDVVILLLSSGANARTPCFNGVTPIIGAVVNNQIEVVKLFARECFDKAHFGEEWKLSLFICAERGYLDQLNILLSHKLVDINAPKGDSNTALHHACCYGHFNIASCLIENGSDINTKGFNGHTCLAVATQENYSDIVQLLLSVDADTNLANNHGNTPLFTAAARGFLPMVELLYENGAELDVVDADGDTPLHDAAFHGYFEIVKFLVSHNANVSYRNLKDKTPLDLAVEQQREDVVAYLSNTS